jgi:hypothetical protein
MLKSLVCFLVRRGGHDYQLRRAPDALFLECLRCGRRSRGWKVPHHRVLRPVEPLRLLLAELIESPNPLTPDRVSSASSDDGQVQTGSLRLTLAARAQQQERRRRERRQGRPKSAATPERRTRDRRRSWLREGRAPRTAEAI